MEDKDISQNYLSIQGWMVQDLKLKGNELLLFALIYGFCQDKESEFRGSIGYMCSWISSTRPTVSLALASLCKKDLIIKRVVTINNVTFNRYKINLQVVKNLYGGSKESLRGGSKESLHNNIIKDNNKYNKEVEEVEETTTTSKIQNVPDFVLKEQKKITPQVPPAPRIDLEAIEDKMRYSQMLSESARKSNQLSEQDYFEGLEAFFLEQRAIEKMPKSESDFKRHFLSWIRIWADKQRKGNQKGKLENLSNQYDRIMKEIDEGNF